MPRTKATRSPQGSIRTKKITKNGRKVTVYDVRKRYYDDAEGKYRDKFKRCLSFAEAQIQLANILRKIEKEKTDSRDVEHTFFELVEYFRENYVKPAVIIRDRQVEGYRADCKALEVYLDGFKAHFGDALLKKISYEDLRLFKIKLATTPIVSKKSSRFPSVVTVNRKLAFLRRIFNVAIQIRWLDANPFKFGKPLIDVGAEAVRQRVLTFEEEAALLAACEGADSYSYERYGKTIHATRKHNPRSHLKLIIIMALDTALRRGEIFKLQREDVFLAEKFIDLPARKTKALRRRLIPISDRLESELQKYFGKTKFAPKDLIFRGAKDCDRALHTACLKAGVEPITFHVLRHTATTWMDEAGISERAKKNMVGHSSDRTHQRYHHLNSDVLAAARNKLDNFRSTVATTSAGKVLNFTKSRKTGENSAA